MIMNLLKNRAEKLIFILLFFVIGYFASQLYFYLDDSYFYYLISSHTLVDSFLIYTKDYGLFRPFTFIYYNFIYPLYSISPSLAHLIPVLFYILSVYLVYKTLILQNLHKKISFIIAFMLSALVFFAEGYGWLSANSAIIVYLLFFLQVYLLEKYGTSLKSFLVLLLLQFISIFTYETTFFMPVALGLLWLQKEKETTIHTNVLLRYICRVFILFIPAFLYLSSYLFFPPKIDTRIKIISMQTAIFNWMNYLFDTVYLFSKTALSNFWGAQSLEGLYILILSPFALVLFILVILIVVYIFFIKDYGSYEIAKNIKAKKFWIFSFVMSLLPLSWQNNFLSFRTLILPSTILLILISIYIVENIQYFSRKKYYSAICMTVKVIIIIICILSFGLQIKIMQNYRKQYIDDVKITREIHNIILSKYPENYDWIYVYLKSLPNNTLSSFVYSDYILSSYYNYWSAEYFYHLITGSWKNIAVEMHYNSVFRSKIPKDILMQKRPLLIMSFTDQKKCSKGACIQLLDDLRL